MAAKKKQNNDKTQQSSTYTHDQDAVQRPDVGVQPEFDARRPAKTYRYDSCLAPELCWDENAEREMTEWLLGLVAEVAKKIPGFKVGASWRFRKSVVTIGSSNKNRRRIRLNN